MAALGSLDKIQLSQGPSVGAVWVIVETARRLGLDQALGGGFAGQLALWQVVARVLEQGSRLSAVRLAQVHAACDVLGIRRGFDVEGGGSCLRIPTPVTAATALLKALKIRLPEALPHTETPVVTRKKLPARRKPR